MTRYKIEQERESCIMCGACVQMCDKFFEMDEVDHKSKVREDEFDNEEDLNCVKDAADSCPVNIIHIEDTESHKMIC